MKVIIAGGNRPGFRRSTRTVDVPDIAKDVPDATKGVKKARLKVAKAGFEHPISLEKLGATKAEAQAWLFEHKCRSWKQKGLAGDYFVANWKVIWFSDPNLAMRFKLALFRK